MGAFFMAGFTIYALARFTPYEWINPKPWIKIENPKLVNQMNMSNAFWFVTGTLLRQGTGVSPQVQNQFLNIYLPLLLTKLIVLI